MSAPVRARTVADAVLRSVVVHAPDVTVAGLRRFFDDDHVHAAVVVVDGVLVTMVERDDLDGADECRAVTALGRLVGRLVAPGADLETVRQQMLADGRRRLAVVDDDGRFVGLLCLKRSGTGFCSEHDVRERRGCA